MATYVNDLRLKEIATGDESGTWGTSTNTNLELIAEAFSFGTEAITTNADTHTTTIADGSTDPGRSIYLKYTGTLDSACTITIGPNTVSKLWFIENGTSGSQNIIISQGSGANVTIPAGHVKAVYSDGAGSGAAIVDAFTNLNLGGTTTVDDLTISDDLSVTDDMTIGGTLGVTGIVTLTDDLIIGDGKTIGSASDVDAMTIASNGQVTFSQTLIGTALDISGDIDVDGTTNLDVVDIDGAVDMASTLAVGGVVTANAGVVVDNITIDGTEIDLSSGNLTIDVAGDIILDAGGDDITFKSGGTEFGSIFKSSNDLFLNSAISDGDIKFRGNDGGSFITALTLDMSNEGSATFNKDIFIGDGNPVRFGDDQDGRVFYDDTNGFIIQNATSDKDILFKGNDGGSTITALTLDMSDAGTATFNHDIKLGDNSEAVFGAGSDLKIYHDGSNSYIEDAGTGSLIIEGTNLNLRANDNSRYLVGTDGTGGSTALYHPDGDSIKLATTSSGIDVTGTVTATTLAGTLSTAAQTNITSLGTLTTLTVDDITINSSSISDSGDLTLDVGGDITLDTDGGDIRLKDDGTNFGKFTNGSGSLHIVAVGSDNDIKFFGNDGGSSVTALILDMSDAGTALFNNKVGIGTSNPTELLHIEGTGETISALVEASDGNQASFDLKNNEGEFRLICDSGELSVFDQTDAVERFRIDTSGNVGIAEVDPDEKLTVKSANYANSQDGGIAIQAGVSSGNHLKSAFKIKSNSSGQFRTTIDTSTGATAGETRESISILASSGNIGIGTASPSANLHVSTSSGDCTVLIEAAENASGSEPRLQLKGTNTSSNPIIEFGDSAAFPGSIEYENSDNSMRLTTNTSEAIRIDSSGNVIVGVSTFADGTGGTSIAGGLIKISNDSTSSGTQMFFTNPNGAVGSISSSGSATAFNTSSDARLKDVTGSARGLEVINELNPVAYNWKADGKADEGLIAQEVKELVPNAVSGSEEDMYQMDYSKLVTHLVKAIQEQQEQIESLTSEIAILKEK